MDDECLKQGKRVFGRDYFDELLERIREICTSERRFYQKITDIYALSVDYSRVATLKNLTQVSYRNTIFGQLSPIEVGLTDDNWGDGAAERRPCHLC